VISRAYVSAVRVAGTLQVNDPVVCPLATVLTVLRSVEAPFFKVMVTGPEAPLQVRVIGLPAVIPLNAELVNSTALTMAMAITARRALEYCILSLGWAKMFRWNGWMDTEEWKCR